MENNIEQRVKKVIGDLLGCDEEQMTPQALIQEDLGADSLDAVEVIMELEKEFSVTIRDEDAEKILTVQNAIDYITDRKG